MTAFVFVFSLVSNINHSFFVTCISLLPHVIQAFVGFFTGENVL